MKRSEFMRVLLKYVKSLPKDEVENIKSYYDELFTEAGVDLDDEVPDSFGNPKRVALEILAESEYLDEVEVKGERVAKEKKTNKWLIILLAILAVPVGIPAALAVLGGVVSVVLAVLAVIFGIGAMVVAPILVLIFSESLTVPTIVSLLGITIIALGFILLVVALGKWLIGLISQWISRKTLERKVQ